MNALQIISLLAWIMSLQTPQKISQNGMEVLWYFEDDQIWIEMSGPTDGWIAIGFNEQQEITGNYLLMGRVVGQQAEVVEHVTLAPGKYQSIERLEGTVRVSSVSGQEKTGKTSLKFALPITALGQYRKDLKPASEYILLLAYSREDDFQHHSMMRTSIKVSL